MQLDDLFLPELEILPAPKASLQAAVQTTVRRTLDGRTVILEQGPAPRAFDLAGGEDSGWVSRGCLERLLAMAALPGAVYRLTPSAGSALQVRFRHEDGPAVAGEAVFVSIPSSGIPAEDDPIKNLRLKLMEVTA